MNNQPTTWLSPNSIRRSRQMLTIVNLSIRRYLFTRNMWVLVILGGLPLIFVALIILGKPITSLTDANRAFQMTFRIYYIHFSIFFIASIFGFSLLRKEVDDRTLHYLFMQPVNRSLIIFSKYFGYIVVTWTYLSAAFLLTYFIMFLPFGLNVMKRELFHMGRAVSLIQECFVMLLALGLYGAVSMVMGTIFKSAWYGIIFYLWEAGLPYLPSTFKYLTISQYLQAITPERSILPASFFELYGDIPTAFECILAVFIVVGFFGGLTLFLIRRYECRYSEM